MADTPQVDQNTESLDEMFSLLTGKAQVAPAAPEEEQEEVEELDPAEDTSATEQEAEEEDGDPEESGEESEPEEEEEILKPKKQTAKERIAEVTAARRQAERERDEARGTLAALESRLRALETGGQPKPEQKAPVGAPAVDPNAPSPMAMHADGSAVYPLGEFDPQFIADLTSYHFDKRYQEMQAKQNEEMANRARNDADAKLQTEWEGRLVETEKQLPDLRVQLGKLETEFSTLEPNYGVYLAQTIMGMENGPQILYYLANHVDEAHDIVASGPQGATLKLGRLDSRIEGALSKKAKAPARTTAAPKPPVSTRGSAAGKVIKADTESLDDFEKLFYSKR